MPRATGVSSQIGRYEEAWESINRLIRRGGSWSGFERNCFYLGSGDGRFVNYSAASGLDFLDDGRALAVWDFDQDGRQDLLLKSRSGPQLRILHNEARSSGRRITLRLQGAPPNRQAVGARVTLRHQGRQRVKEVRAGSGFLSQNASELFFGLGSARAVDRLAVRWPSGRTQSFEGIEVERRYFLKEGGRLESRPFAPSVELAAPGRPEAAGDADVSRRRGRRVWLLDPLALPPLRVSDPQGRPLSLAALRGSPWLLNIWSPDCPVCLREFRAWSGAAPAPGRSPAVLALTLDVASRREEIAAVAGRTSVPVGLVEPRDLLALAILIEDTVHWSRRLALPTSLLIDGEGRIVRLYQGAVDWREIQEDSQNIPDAATRRGRSLPFPGSYHLLDPHRNEFQLGVAFLEAGLPDHALGAFERVLDKHPRDAEALYNRGVVHLEAGDLRAAGESFSAAVSERPDFVDALANLGVVAARGGDLDGALRFLERCLDLRAEHVESLVNLGSVLIQKNRLPEALDRLRKAAALEPGLAAVQKLMGRAYRRLDDPESAREAYERASRLDPRDPEPWSNLGVILAEMGELQDAHAMCRKALEIDATHLSALNNDGLILGALGRLEEARASFRRAISLDPRSPAPYLNLARSHAGAGEKNKARNVLRELLAEVPGEPDARDLLERLGGR